MSWTREQKIAALLRLPWTIRPDKDVDEGYLIARVAEIPSVIATGATPEELERDFWQSLQASLEVSLDYGDPITLPRSLRTLPWDAPRRPPTPLVKTSYRRGEGWQTLGDDATALTGSLTAL